MAATDTRMWKLLLALGVCSLLPVKEREEGPEKLMIFIPVPRACHTVGTPGPVPAPFCQESLLSLLPLSPQPPCSEALVSSCPLSPTIMNYCHRSPNNNKSCPQHVRGLRLRAAFPRRMLSSWVSVLSPPP